VSFVSKLWLNAKLTRSKIVQICFSEGASVAVASRVEARRPLREQRPRLYCGARARPLKFLELKLQKVTKTVACLPNEERKS
jgi:hypothetical protein